VSRRRAALVVQARGSLQLRCSQDRVGAVLSGRPAVENRTGKPSAQRREGAI
jgi:hypothetical protein